jgi:hypothetical protein
MIDLLTDALYLMCLLSSLVCMALLLRGYWRTRMRLLLWSGMCFVLLSLNNAVLFVDVVLLPDIDLHALRLPISFLAGTVLLCGFVWEAK